MSTQLPPPDCTDPACIFKWYADNGQTAERLNTLSADAKHIWQSHRQGVPSIPPKLQANMGKLIEMSDQIRAAVNEMKELYRASLGDPLAKP